MKNLLLVFCTILLLSSCASDSSSTHSSSKRGDWIDEGLKSNPLIQNLFGTPYFNHDTQSIEYRRAQGVADGILGGLQNGALLMGCSYYNNPNYKREQEAAMFPYFWLNTDSGVRHNERCRWRRKKWISLPLPITGMK